LVFEFLFFACILTVSGFQMQARRGLRLWYHYTIFQCKFGQTTSNETSNLSLDDTQNYFAREFYPLQLQLSSTSSNFRFRRVFTSQLSVGGPDNRQPAASEASSAAISTQLKQWHKQPSRFSTTNTASQSECC
jgi:hypothetical protein